MQTNTSYRELHNSPVLYMRRIQQGFVRINHVPSQYSRQWPCLSRDDVEHHKLQTRAQTG